MNQPIPERVVDFKHKLNVTNLVTYAKLSYETSVIEAIETSNKKLTL